MSTVAGKLEKVEKNLQECQNELDEVGKKLRNRKDSLPPSEVTRLQSLSVQLGAEVVDCEQQIDLLRRENRKSMALSVLICAVVVFVYCAYKSITILAYKETSTNSHCHPKIYIIRIDMCTRY